MFRQLVFKRHLIIFSLPFFLLSVFIVGCDKLNLLNIITGRTSSGPAAAQRVVKGTIIAKINDYPITLEDLNQEIDAYNSLVPPDKPEQKISTREQKIEYLNKDLIRQILLYQEALRRGIDKNEDILRALEKTKMNLLAMELAREEIANIDASPEEIEESYQLYKEQFKEPEERQIREIVVPTEQEAREILIQLLQGADFATKAIERSKSASAKNGGDLGFIQKNQKFPQFAAVAFSDALEVGKISNIFKGPDGYYIIKLEAKRGGKQKSLSEMQEDIKRGLIIYKQQDKINRLVDNLDKAAKKEIYENEIK